MNVLPSCVCLLLCAWAAHAQAPERAPLSPFEADEHTLLLYHLDEGEGLLAHDASGNDYHGQVQGATWAPGKFGGALRFDGKSAAVFREATPAIVGLEQITVECWFAQDDPAGRQFLMGKDVSFHFDVTDGAATSMSIYNEGGRVENAEGLRHQHLGTGLGSLRPGRWYHNAVSYDGEFLSFFLDGVLRHRVRAARDFLLGIEARGLWVGSYVGTDFWFSGRIDELRVSDCVRYDPDNALKVGERVFEMPERGLPPRAVREPQTTGRATLEVTLRKLHGGDAVGWVRLKPRRRPAAVVGRYELKDMEPGEELQLSIDVSDETEARGPFILGLEPEGRGGYFAVTQATLRVGDEPPGRWRGHAASRRTFDPPILIPLFPNPGPVSGQGEFAPRLLVPHDADRLGGDLEFSEEEDGQPACLVGDGYAEWWFETEAECAYRVYMRYAATVPRPCDLVIDGQDLHPFHMAARNTTDGLGARNALWEYQGTVTLGPGVHWVRVQDVLPDIVALAFELTAKVPPARVPWERHAVPEGDFLAAARWWSDSIMDTPPLRLAPTVRVIHRGAWDLEPFGRLRFGFEGRGSGHVVSLWLVDAKGDEKLLWRARDTEAGVREVSVPVSFEGNDTFDPGRVEAVCIESDEGNTRPREVNRFAGAIIGPVFDRRDAIAQAEGHAARVAQARERLASVLREAPRRAGALLARGFRPWTKPVVPEEHPLFAAAEPKPVTRATLGQDFHATGARSIRPDTLDDFHVHYDFGDVCWPHIGMCPLRDNFETEEAYRKALEEFERLLEGVRDRGLLLFDVWGYVPHNPQFPWKIAPEHHEILLRVFGDRFLGYDNGEQDGRYIGAYAHRGAATNRKEAWDDFVAWDEHICTDHQDYMNATGSLNFSHYYGERNARMLGLETAQGLPSDTLMFAFLRGAGRQYGRLIYQATSIWNRFGYNMYHDRKTTAARGYGYGPNKGCSLSLHRRLFFSGYLGGHSIAGTETAQFTADRLESGAPELSPLGRQHLDIMDWVRRHPDRGVQYTPVAFMLDFYNGWNMPRHLYRSDRYRIWGKFPYEKGDYVIDGMFRMVWPGYEDASYLRNERGFICPTPYGDIFDVLTNRCHPDVLAQYGAVMLLGEVEMTPEVVANLGDFVREGGDLLLDARHARALPEGFCGVSFGEEANGVLSHVVATGETFEEHPYTYTVLDLAGAEPLVANEAGHPLMAVHEVGGGARDCRRGGLLDDRRPHLRGARDRQHGATLPAAGGRAGGAGRILRLVWPG